MTHLASLPDDGRDGRLVVVSADHQRFLPAPVASMQAAIERWDAVAGELSDLAARADAGAGEPLAAERPLSPFPRAYQYCEGSTYLSHMERCRAARGAALPPGHGRDPAVLQGASDRFPGPTEPIVLGDEAWGLDIEATVAVAVDDVPMGADADTAAGAIRLVMLLNDLTLRDVLTVEFAKGVGFFQAKPLRPFAPIAVTPEGLGEHWDGRLLRGVTIRSWINGELLGALDPGVDCAFDFGAVIAHAARTRPLAAGTIVGSGTVSNRDADRGFGCLAEKRAHEILRDGATDTRYLRAGDTVHVEAFRADGHSLFGALEAAVVSPTEEAP